jgi:hypothetical protein
MRSAGRWCVSRTRGHCPLCEPEVFGPAVDGRARAVPQAVKREPALEPGTLLPQGEGVPTLPRQDPPPRAADEERCVRLEAFALALLPGPQRLELGPDEAGQHDLLDRRLVRAALIAAAVNGQIDVGSTS